MEQKAYGGRTVGDISPSEFARLEGGGMGNVTLPSIPETDHTHNGCGCGCGGNGSDHTHNSHGCGCNSCDQSNSDNGCGCVHDACPCGGGWGLCQYPLAMAYAPCQAFHSVYDVETALHRGTLFAELDLPFEAAGGCNHDNRRACR